MMRLSFFGLGYVGTVHVAGFASKGFPVMGFDIDEKKLRAIASGRSPFFEPGLEDLIRQGVKAKRLKMASTPEEAVLNSDITFITVGTPTTDDGSIDLKYVIDAAKMIGKTLAKKDGRHTVVVKSTVVPGTTEDVVRKTLEGTSGKVAFKDFGLATNPEFLREGSAIEDFMKPDRIVIGVNDEESKRILEEVYSRFDCPKIITGLATAELIKYTSNAFLAMKVSFINMIANLCQKIPGADVETVARGIGLDKRIGPQFLRAGAGWGGSCWPKDLKALMHYGEDRKVELPLIESTLRVNECQPYKMVDLAEALMGDLRGKRVAVLGLAFKPDTDDARDAVSIKIVRRLLEKGAGVVVYDPVTMNNFRRIFDDESVEYSKSPLDCIKGADCAMLVTEWDIFSKIRPEDYLKLMKYPALVDGRRICDPKDYSKRLKFKAIGLADRKQI
jgi:UDPglucose 6-dehydrogenase